MRNKLLIAFFIVILTALLSNLIFERLIMKDFEDYAGGAREDNLYLVLASIEGAYAPFSPEGTESGAAGGLISPRNKGVAGGLGPPNIDPWQMESLAGTLHWAMMLGFDVEVRDAKGNKVTTSKEALDFLSPSMRKRMDAIVHPHAPEGEFEEYPLFVGGEEIGSLLVRPLSREPLRGKESIFKKRGRTFLTISFLIAGGGAIFLSFALSIYLTGPVMRLKRAAEAVAAGDLSVRVNAGQRDEIGRLTETFNHMVESLEREEALRRRLTSNIAHELRTPLAVMRANIEAVSDGVTGAEEGVNNLKTELQRLITLVEGIEDMARAEASFFKPAERTMVDLHEFLEGISGSMRPLFAGKGLALTLEKKEAVVITDAEKLETAVRNLLSNALRYTERGGVRIDYGADKKEFFIEVSDTGRGIADEELELIFKRFWRGGHTPLLNEPIPSSSEKVPASKEGRTAPSLGLGLSIAKELVEVMGGRIEVKSKVGEGTTFRVILPYAA